MKYALHTSTFIVAVMAGLTIMLSPPSVGPSGVRQPRDPNLFRMEGQTMLQVRHSYRVVAEAHCLLSEGSLSPH
jgi:hypothetical protein